MKLPARYKCDWCGVETECRDGDMFLSAYPEGWKHSELGGKDYCVECKNYLISVLPWAIKDRLTPDESMTELKGLLPLLGALTRTDFETAKAVAAVENDGEAQTKETPQA